MYQEQDDEERRRITPEEYFDLNKFRLVDLETEGADKSGGEKEALAANSVRIAFCDTCQVLRPPRAFHCGSCNVCVEVHDHHCPWVGTCVARRNHRYFTLFLLFTGIHGLHTFILTIISMAQLGIYIADYEDKDPHHVVRVVLVVYSLIFGMVLIGFFCFQNHLILSNITSNEHIRGKWNGGRTRISLARI